MKRYIFGRIVRSIISIFIVMTVVSAMVYIAIPRDRVFDKDGPTLNKLSATPDLLADYKNSKYEELGYIDYVTQKELCMVSENPQDCAKVNSVESGSLAQSYEKKGYKINHDSQGYLYLTRDNTAFEIVMGFYSRLIQIDTPNFVQDIDNLDIERKVYFGSDHNGVPAVMCSGCKHKYLLYFNGSFPFIHQNFIKLNLGISFPTFKGQSVLDVVAMRQGEADNVSTTFPSGTVATSAANLHTARYKDTALMDKMDTNKFVDNYADTDNNFKNPSMIGVSFLIGGISLLVSYLIAIPFAVIMARKKGKFFDKLGIVYINFLIAVPSLAFIFFVRNFGNSVLGLPEQFPIYGFGDLRSYVLPVFILGLLGTSSLMIWIRRYMIDQSNADYVKFARAKGLSEKEIFRKHIFRNAIIPFVNGIPGSVIATIGGSVITETMFAIPGMGKMLPDAISQNNNAMIIALTFIFTSLSILSLLLGDILMIMVDPRIQLSSKGDVR